MSDFNKINAIKTVQSLLGLKVDGVDGRITWSTIIAKLTEYIPLAENKETPVVVVEEPKCIGLSDKTYDLILKYEVGGGKNYYNKALKNPTYPGGASGVTIGIGYDLGYNTSTQFQNDWMQHLDGPSYNALLNTIGKKGIAAKNCISSVKNISVSWEAAESVFQSDTLPRFINETKKAFPGCDKLHPDAFGVLVSLVFNRGGSVVGASRVEMNNIKKAITGEIKTLNLYHYIAGQIVAMKRLWVGKGLDGLLTRRDEEARIVKSCA
jgi:GH24 family phage-related lysozyme (muramidase)